MICDECKQPHKVGIPYQKDRMGAIHWVCKKCFDEHNYGKYMRKDVRHETSGT